MVKGNVFLGQAWQFSGHPKIHLVQKVRKHCSSNFVGDRHSFTHAYIYRNKRTHARARHTHTQTHTSHHTSHTTHTNARTHARMPTQTHTQTHTQRAERFDGLIWCYATRAAHKTAASTTNVRTKLRSKLGKNHEIKKESTGENSHESTTKGANSA